jgi:Putative auto-transporter adhesin, head GIN domain
MSANPHQLLSAVLLVAFALAGCRDHHVDRGPMQSETRPVAEFDSISLRGSAQLRVKIGPERSVEVEGNEKALKRLSTEVNGNTLYIDTSTRDWNFSGGSSRLVINVVTPHVGELRIEGGNDVRLVGLDGGRSNIDIEGAAHLKAEGRLDELTVHMAGAGHADLKGLLANTAKVTVDGVGSVFVNATESLDATMNGVGAILYSGTPRDVNTSMNGVGTISKDRDRKDRESQEEPDTAPIDPDTLQPEYEKKELSTQPTSGVI